MSKQGCIYCSPTDPITTGYTTEHVIHKAFGHFKNSLTLPEGVCRDCNKYFGETIDLILTRGSAEAVKRLDYGIKPASEAQDIIKKRVIIEWSTNDQFNGLKLEYGHENGELIIQLIPQVGFERLDGKGRLYVTEELLADLSKPLPNSINLNSPAIVYSTDEMQEMLKDLLIKRNIKIDNTSDEIKLPFQKGEEIEVAVKASFDESTKRAIAKISFNYLTNICGIDFSTHYAFDKVRRYVRYGEKQGLEPVISTQKPILEYDGIKYRQTNGHLLTIDWSPDSRNLIGQVSLFNFITYHIMLAQDFSGIWRPVRSGHIYDIDTLEVRPLSGVSKNLLP